MVRHKNRYMVIEINQLNKSKQDVLVLRQKSLFSAIFQAVMEMHGDFGMAAIQDGFTAKYCNEKTRIALIRTRHGPHKLLASALPFINMIDNKKVTVNTLYIGATIKQCYKFVLNYQQRKFEEFCMTLNSDAEKLTLKNIILNLDKIDFPQLICHSQNCMLVADLSADQTVSMQFRFGERGAVRAMLYEKIHHLN